MRLTRRACGIDHHGELLIVEGSGSPLRNGELGAGSFAGSSSLIFRVGVVGAAASGDGVADAP